MDDKPAPKPMPPVRRRHWKWPLRIVLSALMILLCGSVWMIANREWTRRQSEREWEGARAEIDQSDPDWTWERLNARRPRPPEGKNGATLIPQIKKLSAASWGKELAKEEWKPLLEVPPNVRYTPAVVVQARRALAASGEAVKLARTLKDYPNGHRDIHLTADVLNTPLEDTQHTRYAADALRWDVVIALEDGDSGRAVDDLRAILNASRSIGDEPFLISQLVRIAVRSVALRSAEWLLAQTADAPGLAELQQALAEDAEEPLLFYGVRGDRGAFDKLFANLDSGQTTPDQAISRGFKDWQAQFGWWCYRGHLPADRAFALSWMTLYIEAARLPIHEQQAAVAAIPNPTKEPARLLSGALLPAVDKVAEAHWRSAAEARCAVVGLACERFRQKHGRWPTELAELVPAFLPALPTDPYGGGPLVYAKTTEGVVVHSIGNRTSPLLGLQAAVPAPRPGLPEGVAFGFVLWNPDQRRLPPPAPMTSEGEQP